MTVSDDLEATLLALLFHPNTLQRSTISALSAEDWVRIDAWSIEHRCAPYLYYAVQDAGFESLIPDDLLKRLSSQHNHAAMRALSMQREMVGVNNTLNGAGIAHLFLKGAYLAPFAYPSAALRPLRDLDVLVAEDKAIEAFDALLNHGFERNPNYSGTPQIFAETHKHLPPLRSQDARISIEVHYRLNDEACVPGGRIDSQTLEGLFPRRMTRKLAGAELSFPGPADFLLHLCTHAVYSHLFNNGPQVISDIGWFLSERPIVWQDFWKLAHDQGTERGALLVLALVEREWGPLGITWPNGGEQSPLRADDPVLAIAAHSLLRSFNQRGDVALRTTLAEQDTALRKLGVLLRRAFPPRMEISRGYPVSSQSPMVFAWYPLHLLRLVTVRVPAILRSRVDLRTERDIDNVRAVRSWLNEIETSL